MNSAAALLDRAREVHAGAGTSSTRIACWIARAALEAAVADLIRAKELDPGDRSSMRSRLSCVQSLYGNRPQIVEAAEFAWAGLSQACHQHAFQLDAVPSEVAHLMDLVERVLVGDSGTRSRRV